MAKVYLWRTDMRYMKVVIVLLFGLMVIVGYQNCSSNFSSKAGTTNEEITAKPDSFDETVIELILEDE